MKTIPEFIEDIERRARAVGLNGNALAEAAGVSRQTLGNWKSGRSSPTYDHAQRIDAKLAEMERRVGRRK